MSRVFPWSACAAFSAVLAFAQTPSSIGIFMDFDSAPGLVSLDVMKREVAALLRPSGVSLNWRLARENHGDQAFSKLVVLKFKGTCRAALSAQPAGDFGTLGETHDLGFTLVSHGRVLPFSEVECDKVRQSLAYLAPTAGEQERQRALGLAMGRVVAHELYHILARTTAHAAKGMAMASHSLKDLISNVEPAFLEADSRAMREALTQ